MEHVQLFIEWLEEALSSGVNQLRHEVTITCLYSKRYCCLNLHFHSPICLDVMVLNNSQGQLYIFYYFEKGLKQHYSKMLQ
jgi:hypothetical protein